MKIVALVRTLNEERNIADFCAAYDWADMVLVADGGSTDDTVVIAEHFPNVWTLEFEERVEWGKGVVGNPQGRHVNFLIDWATDEGADWVIFDDCDCRPNQHLRHYAKDFIEDNGHRCIKAQRLHLWGQDEYFPKMTTGPGLWAWRLFDCDIRGNEDVSVLQIDGVPEDCLSLSEPFCLLHYSYPDEKVVRAKAERARAMGRRFIHPLDDIYAPPEPLPDWIMDRNYEW